MPVKQITNWTVFGEIQTGNIDIIAYVFNAFPLNLTSVQTSPQNPRLLDKLQLLPERCCSPSHWSQKIRPHHTCDAGISLATSPAKDQI